MEINKLELKNDGIYINDEKAEAVKDIAIYAAAGDVSEVSITIYAEVIGLDKLTEDQQLEDDITLNDLRQISSPMLKGKAE